MGATEFDVARPMELPCPLCASPSTSLKQYQYVELCIFLGHGLMLRRMNHRSCPSCMRRHILKRLLINILPANVIWLVVLLPWGVGLLFASYREGHSPEVLEGPFQRTSYGRGGDEEELSWGRVLAVVALLVCWMPILSLPVCGLAFQINRRSSTWTFRASQLALVISLLIHLAMAVLLLWEQVQ